MQKNSVEFKELIYDFMNGSLNLEENQLVEGKYIKNEFAEGLFCNKKYEEVFYANRRLCERLGVEEDCDVEIIINNLLDIGKYLSMKMYDYGMFFSSPSIR